MPECSRVNLLTQGAMFPRVTLQNFLNLSLSNVNFCGIWEAEVRQLPRPQVVAVGQGGEAEMPVGSSLLCLSPAVPLALPPAC